MISLSKGAYSSRFDLGGRMSVLNKNFTVVTRYIRRLRGGSQPILAQASDGLLYVIKFTNNLQGPNLCFNESIGNELYRACGLQVPTWKPLLVLDSFLDQNPDCWLQTAQGRLRPEPLMCFGSRFLGGPGVRLFEILPQTSFKRVRNLKSFWLAWLIDICARHADNRQALFLEDAKGRLGVHFVDNGHLFGGPNGDSNTTCDRKYHCRVRDRELVRAFRCSRYLDSRIYQSVSSSYLMDLKRMVGSLDADRLWRNIQTLPEDWKTKSALDGFTHCLCTLSTPSLLQDIVDSMVGIQERLDELEGFKPRIERKPPAEVLCAGVQATARERRLGSRRADSLACG
jgi:hypothetical protein